jgi:hypothetical protein
MATFSTRNSVRTISNLLGNRAWFENLSSNSLYMTMNMVPTIRKAEEMNQVDVSPDAESQGNYSVKNNLSHSQKADETFTKVQRSESQLRMDNAPAIK